MNPEHHVPLRQMIHTGGMNSVTARIADKSSPIFFSAEWASGNIGDHAWSPRAVGALQRGHRVQWVHCGEQLHV
jgi:hypothetical protein